MSRVRHDKRNRRTAAAYHQEGSGCSSFYWLAPLSVLFFGTVIAIALIHISTQTAILPNNSIASNGVAPLFTPEVQYWNASILHWSTNFKARSKFDCNGHAAQILRRCVCAFLRRGDRTLSGYARSFYFHRSTVRSRYQCHPRINIFAPRVRYIEPKYYVDTGGVQRRFRV